MNLSYTGETVTSTRSSTETHWSTDYSLLPRSRLLALGEERERSAVAAPYHLTSETRRFSVEASRFMLYFKLLLSLQRYSESLPDWSALIKGATPSETLGQTAHEVFTSIPEVDAIYQDEPEDETLFWVFINNEKYDDDLMELLISREEVLMDKHPESHIWVRYIPLVLCHDPREVVGNTARLVFAR